MTDQDRGAYTPQTDAPLAFDARYARGAGERPLPMTLVVSGVILVLLVAALAFFYRSGVRSSGAPPQVVGTPVADSKAPPSDAASAASDGAAGLQIYKAEAVPPGEGHPAIAATLAPPPEAPAPRPVPTSPVEQADLRPALSTGPAAVAATPAASTPAPVAAPIKPKPIQAVRPVKPAAKAVAKPEPITETASGGPVAQIGAFSSEALAQKGWSDVAALMPTQMAGKSRKVEMGAAGGKTFYRAFVGGFATKAAADSFCASLKAAGRGCMVK